jgi:hypothetical protein
VGTAVVLGALRSAGIRPGLAASSLAAAADAMTASTAPMTALGITDPRTWTAQAWISDVIPHLAYGAVTAAVLQYLDGSP